MNAKDAPKPTCFIAMPVATRAADIERYENDSEHWNHVLESLFVPAVTAAGFEAIRPIASGADLIHGLIIRHLSTADLVLVDLSSHNANVFFELGVRTSLNKPIALVKDEHTSLPFDVSGINTYSYDSKLRGWNMESDRSNLTTHVVNSVDSCSGENPLWRQFGLTIKAHEPETAASPFEAKLDLLVDSVHALQQDMSNRRGESPGSAARRLLEERRKGEFLDPSTQYGFKISSEMRAENLRSFIQELALSENGGLPEIQSIDETIVQLRYPALPDKDVAGKIIGMASKYGLEAIISLR